MIRITLTEPVVSRLFDTIHKVLCPNTTLLQREKIVLELMSQAEENYTTPTDPTGPCSFSYVSEVVSKSGRVVAIPWYFGDFERAPDIDPE